MKKLFCSQPRVLICIELKIAEALGICAIVGFVFSIELVLVKVGLLSNVDKATDWIRCWFVTLIFMFLAFIIGFGIYHAIKANWAWADRIRKK